MVKIIIDEFGKSLE